MRRFFTEPESLDETEVILKDDEFHHLRNVSRLEVGEFVELLDGAGRVAKAKIIKIEKKSATLEVLERKTLPPPPTPHIEIVLCLPRFQKMDLIIQKAVELGCTKITPVVSERSFLKSLSKEITEKIPRWQKISDEACKQSGRVWPMKFGEAEELENIIPKRKSKNALFLYEGESAIDIKSALTTFSSAPEEITVFIGAEGGFSPRELESFKKNGLKPITLGSLVLRVETACIAILSVIDYHFNKMC
jgi:16S rRNA (uracil1498-N3)-methyltransferase